MKLPLLPNVEPDTLFTNAYCKENYLPAVYWQLNDRNGLHTLSDARVKARELFAAAGYAEGEAAISKGLLGLSEQSSPKGFGAKSKAARATEIMIAQLQGFLRQGRTPLMEGVEVIFGYRTREGLINVTWYGELIQWSCSEAIAYAIRLLETAEAAENDAYFRWFLQERLGLGIEEGAAMIADLQAFRHRRQLEDLLGAST